MRYLIGGNAQQAKDYIRRKGLADAVVIDDTEALLALRSPGVFLIGTYLIREDVQAFESALVAVGAIVAFAA